jgi:murein DD-endopeptidase MepM/ murein hydrolase activator NlpD
MQLAYPLDKIYITQYFGERPEIYKPYKGHTGIDFRTIFADSPTGKRSVLAVADGFVKELGDQGTTGYGKFIRLEHTDGSQTVYGHLDRWVVTQKQQVTQGEKIGISDNTGFSSAPHLHFGYRPKEYDTKNGFAGYVNPLPLFITPNTTLTSKALVHAEPLALLKQSNNPAIYIYGHDGYWHGLGDMEILKMLAGSYDPTKVLVVDQLPSNISYEIHQIDQLN